VSSQFNIGNGSLTSRSKSPRALGISMAFPPNRKLGDLVLSVRDVIAHDFGTAPQLTIRNDHGARIARTLVTKPYDAKPAAYPRAARGAASSRWNAS